EDECGGDGEYHTFATIVRRGGDAPERPAEHVVEDCEDDDDRGGDADRAPDVRGLREERHDVRNEAEIPVEVDVAAEERGRRHVGVAAEHEEDPDRGDPPERGRGKDPAPAHPDTDEYVNTEFG